jgi:Tfp pilus assembly major pilin PilA
MAAALSISAFRPLRSAHWTLPALLVAVFLVLFWGRPCRDGPLYLEAVAATLFFAVVAWSNHIALAPVRTHRDALAVVAGSLKDILLLLVAFVLASIPLALVMPAYQCYTDRAKAAEVVLAGSGLREEVERNALAQRTLSGSGRGIEFRPSGRAKWGLVTNEGQIVVVGDDPAVVFTLTPTLVGGSVTWTCRGFPTKFAPKLCRHKDEI